MVFESIWESFVTWVHHYFGWGVEPLTLLFSTIVLFILLLILMIPVLARLTEANVGISLLIAFIIVALSWYTKTILWIVSVFSVMSFIVIGAIAILLIGVLVFIAWKSASYGGRYALAAGREAASYFRRVGRAFGNAIRNSRTREELNQNVNRAENYFNNVSQGLPHNTREGIARLVKKMEKAVESGQKEEAAKLAEKICNMIANKTEKLIDRGITLLKRELTELEKSKQLSVETTVRNLKHHLGKFMIIYEKAGFEEDVKEFKELMQELDDIFREFNEKRDVLKKSGKAEDSKKMMEIENEAKEKIKKAVESFLQERSQHKKWKKRKVAEKYVPR